MNKSNNDNIKEEKTQLTNNANRLAEQDLEHISELSEQDWEAVSGGAVPLLALGAARIIVPAVGGFIAKEIIKNEVVENAGTNFVENASTGGTSEGSIDILL
ncbi:hypothetical protein C7B62_23225 [Pleurocapsa sp. CCALA 161]|uniref:hypothetical protein n=1 Tax=Pleurocapsa sp. CCALA 161 TaxID=2107688 RepID=UPI000D07D2EF|nr:hypothetical protein [Pleurocapsa sp. CCALA 161]PSB06300.1 hypothetical protein C7B62_23225 [Pleurocapsa sp. CCALA 161]